MSAWVLTMRRDWAQDAERQPVTDFEFVEYDELDDQGFRGHITIRIEVGPGKYVNKFFRLRPEQFKFVVESIAERYHGGGPK